MNYLAHAYFVRLAESPYFIVGACLPDLIAQEDRRARFPLIEPGLGDPASQGVEALRGGMAHHLLLDREWHGGQWFLSAQKRTLALLRKTRLGDIKGLRLSFLSHIMVELMVDHHLLKENAQLTDCLYGAFDAVDLATCAGEAERQTTRPIPGLLGRLEGFASSKYLTRYRRLDDMMPAFPSILRRARQTELRPEDLSSLRESLDHVHDDIKAHLSELLESLAFLTFAPTT